MKCNNSLHSHGYTGSLYESLSAKENERKKQTNKEWLIFGAKNIDVCILINMLIEYKEENADSIKIRPSSLGSSDQLLLT